jgi:hypothetical protein
MAPLSTSSAQLRVDIVLSRAALENLALLRKFVRAWLGDLSVACSSYLGYWSHPGAEMQNNVNSETFR